MTLHSDGQRQHQGPGLFASTLNTPTFGSGMPAVPHARIDDGRLDALLAGQFTRGSALRMLPLLLAGLHLRHPRVHSWPYTQLDIACASGVPLAADGEYLGVAREVTIRCQTARLQVVRH